MTPRQFIHKTFGRDVTNGKGIENLLTKYAEHMLNLREFSKQTLNNGGATTSLNLTSIPNKGFWVSLQGHEKIHHSLSDELTIEDIEQAVRSFVIDKAEVLSDHDNFLGGWIDNGILYLDISVNISDKRKAIEFGIENNQRAIFDISKGITINIPSPQRHGTLFQRKTYMELAINKLCQL